MKRVTGPMRVVIAIWVIAIIGIVLVAPLLWWFFTNFVETIAPGIGTTDELS